MIAPVDFVKSSKFGFSIKLFLFICLFYTVIFYSSMAKKDFSKLKEKWNEVTVSKMAPLGNQADSEIIEVMTGERVKREDRCDWLKKNADRFDKEKVKATQKALGCRHSRMSKDRKKR